MNPFSIFIKQSTSSILQGDKVIFFPFVPFLSKSRVFCFFVFAYATMDSEGRQIRVMRPVNYFGYSAVLSR